MTTYVSLIVSTNEANILPLISKYIRKNHYRFVYTHYHTKSVIKGQSFTVVDNYYIRHHFKSITTYLREIYTYLKVKDDV